VTKARCWSISVGKLMGNDLLFSTPWLIMTSKFHLSCCSVRECHRSNHKTFALQSLSTIQFVGFILLCEHRFYLLLSRFGLKSHFSINTFSTNKIFHKQVILIFSINSPSPFLSSFHRLSHFFMSGEISVIHRKVKAKRGGCGGGAR